MITAYQKTGKSTFISNLINNKIKINIINSKKYIPRDLNILYNIFKSKIKNNTYYSIFGINDKLDLYNDFDINGTEISFVKHIKDYVHSKLKINNLSLFELEKCKDNNYLDIESNTYKSLNQFYLEYAEDEKTKNLNIWSEKVFNTFKDNFDNINYITDFKFYNEYLYMKNRVTNLKTTRIYRSSVPISDKYIESEHDLDQFETDYLLVTSPLEFYKALRIFPQYKNYKYVATLVYE